MFAIAILWFICTIMSGQFWSSWIRTHPTIERSMRLCTTPSFCKQTFVSGKVASPKSIAGDTTVSNNFSRTTKEIFLFRRVSLYLWNLFQATCKRWANSISFLARKLPVKLCPSIGALIQHELLAPFLHMQQQTQNCPTETLSKFLPELCVLTSFCYPFLTRPVVLV